MRRMTLTLFALALTMTGCGERDPRPAGPEAIEVPEVQVSTAAEDVARGQELFAKKGCVACHKIGGGRLVGPDLKGVTARRNPRWMARMILHPEQMLQQDETAKELLKTYFTPMANQHIDPDAELPAILSYLKANEN